MKYEQTKIKIYPVFGDAYVIIVDGHLTEDEIDTFIDDHCQNVDFHEVKE